MELRWQRAALLGSLWAANEIVLGSFLHNVGFPFTGTLLASIGVSLMVTGARLWDDRGVIWRAGLVCALMKSISPSAVILNPMIGIMAEAWLLWLILTVFGRNPVACLVGGWLATMIPLMQQMVNVIIAYGPDAARIYSVIYHLVASWFGMQTVTPLHAILIVTVASGVPGVLAAGVGIAVARRVISLPPPERQPTTSDMLPTLDRLAPGQHFSVVFLFWHVIILVAVLLLLAEVTSLVQLLLVAAYVLMVFVRYPTLRRKFARPQMWLQFAVVTTLAGFVFGMLGPMGSWWKGLLSGLQMTIRALFVITAFSGISVELRNPRLVNWFLRRGLGALGGALDSAFRSLPTMVSTLGAHLNTFRTPVRTFSRMFAVVLRELNERNRAAQGGPRVFILTGAQGSGKTTMIEKVLPLVRQRGRTVAGIRAPVVLTLTTAPASGIMLKMYTPAICIPCAASVSKTLLRRPVRSALMIAAFASAQTRSPLTLLHNAMS